MRLTWTIAAIAPTRDGSTAAEGMRRRVRFAPIGLGLDDPAGQQTLRGPVEEDAPQKVSRQHHGISSEEPARQTG